MLGGGDGETDGFFLNAAGERLRLYYLFVENDAAHPMPPETDERIRRHLKKFLKNFEEHKTETANDDSLLTEPPKKQKLKEKRKPP